MTTTRFSTGTFAPAPRRAPQAQMIAAQGRTETILFLRHGEQQLLSVIIPLVALVLTATMPMFSEQTSLAQLLPMVLAIATSSSGFTGQAIAVAFDRRYGALKRTGASGVPASTIIFGKVIAVAAMSALQILLLGSVALFLGWRASPGGVVLGLVILLLGITTFTALGMLMGGTLSSEMVLALANLIWFVLVGALGWVVFSHGLDAAGWYTAIPTVALAAGLTDAFAGVVPWLEIAVMAAWAVVASVLAVRWFRFEA
ncbi:MAG TPA: ABC transporter permease [Corynebacterium pollutisoli]|uniref:ABC transporter permease n=1 Tax=Corynebacterium pollutisoli TaxID=1610489 RepID=A0A7X8RHZ2_9CORY|nr:ABC transporter permease [Corynebacterium pollutisoli]HJD78865.1 ABC transporter permease [Corynebacterium pollutisoli]